MILFFVAIVLVDGDEFNFRCDESMIVPFFHDVGEGPPGFEEFAGWRFHSAHSRTQQVTPGRYHSPYELFSFVKNHAHSKIVLQKTASPNPFRMWILANGKEAAVDKLSSERMQSCSPDLLWIPFFVDRQNRNVDGKTKFKTKLEQLGRVKLEGLTDDHDTLPFGVIEEQAHPKTGIQLQLMTRADELGDQLFHHADQRNKKRLNNWHKISLDELNAWQQEISGERDMKLCLDAALVFDEELFDKNMHFF